MECGDKLITGLFNDAVATIKIMKRQTRLRIIINRRGLERTRFKCQLKFFFHVGEQMIGTRSLIFL